MKRPFKIAVVFGTRPEAIKVAPVIAHLLTRDEFQVTTVLTGQHREMLDQVVGVFDIPVHHDLDIMQPRQTLGDVTAALCTRITEVLQQDRPDCVIVQGDTTSCFVGALTAFYENIPVAHVEAGLRTYDIRQPFPEEMNRRLAGALTRFHFAPTDSARDNLLAEKVSPDRIWVTGNTGIDALRIISERDDITPAGQLAEVLNRCRHAIVTVTSHRRENAPFMQRIAHALAELAQGTPETDVVFPVHLSPTVRDAVVPILRDVPRCYLIEPLAYDQFVSLMKRSQILLTDSGGIQEEAPYLGKPVLVMRRKTERPEAVHAGTVKLVGDEKDSIVQTTRELLTNDPLRTEMSRAINPYGDGHAAQRIADVLAAQLAHSD